MGDVSRRDLKAWCSIPVGRLAGHPDAKIPLSIVDTPAALAEAMARELVDTIKANHAAGKPTRAIIPCGPSGWYPVWTRLVNAERVDLRSLHVFHMDECLDWQGRALPDGHPYNFRSFMEKNFYGGIPADLNVPAAQRHWLNPATLETVVARLAEAPVDLTLGGWGQDGHFAYNQARRHPYSEVTLEDVAGSTARVQENNWDTMLALAQRTFGGAWQFVPPMSVTLGVRECFAARKVRLYSDTGAWKQTALRVALFGPVTRDYPMTLLQRHPDARLTATAETARHPIAEHPEWALD